MRNNRPPDLRATVAAAIQDRAAEQFAAAPDDVLSAAAAAVVRLESDPGDLDAVEAIGRLIYDVHPPRDRMAIATQNLRRLQLRTRTRGYR